MTEQRLENIARIAGLDIEIVRDYVEYDGWNNMDEHIAWLHSASDAEIAVWVKSCYR